MWLRDVYSQNYKQIGEQTKQFWDSLSQKILRANEGTYGGNSIDRWLRDNEKKEDAILGDGTQAVVLYPKDYGLDVVGKVFFTETRLEDAEQQLAALHLACENQVNRVPKPVAIKDNILVMSEIMGSELKGLKPEVIENISKDQIIELFKTIDQLTKLGISIDFGSDGTNNEDSLVNVLYDQDEGFSLIDFCLDGSPRDITYSINKLKAYFSKHLNIGDLFNTAWQEFQKQNADKKA